MNTKNVIVSDTSPLIYLMKINSLSLLGRVFEHVYIPTKVYDELTVNKKYSKEIEMIQNASFIIVAAVKDKIFVNNLMDKNDIDQGESEAIVLAQEMGIGKILIDDKKGEVVAINSKLETLVTTEIFVEAYKQEIINEEDLKQVIFAAEKNAQFLPAGFIEELSNIPYEYGRGLEP